MSSSIYIAVQLCDNQARIGMLVTYLLLSPNSDQGSINRYEATNTLHGFIKRRFQLISIFLRAKENNLGGL
jgi:hypothetical protein